MTDREKLIELVHDGEQQCSKILCRNCEHYAKLEKCKANIIADHLISHGVTVRERGRWIVPKIPHITVVGICSECGKMSDRNYNFCPNCGADMRPKGEGEEDGK